MCSFLIQNIIDIFSVVKVWKVIPPLLKKKKEINTSNWETKCLYIFLKKKKKNASLLIFSPNYRYLKRSLCLVQSVCRSGSAVKPGCNRPNQWGAWANERLICPVTDALYRSCRTNGSDLDRYQQWFLYAIAVNLLFIEEIFAAKGN